MQNPRYMLGIGENLSFAFRLLLSWLVSVVVCVLEVFRISFTPNHQDPRLGWRDFRWMWPRLSPRKKQELGLPMVHVAMTLAALPLWLCTAKAVSLRIPSPDTGDYLLFWGALAWLGCALVYQAAHGRSVGYYLLWRTKQNDELGWERELCQRTARALAAHAPPAPPKPRSRL